uniref:Reverse transcriptase Ty1/copia-type domain-containing protein n=1 Tax=Fagus sylvatica TaxID=28930 RepID=A0A2N9EL77_FAGSY
MKAKFGVPPLLRVHGLFPEIANLLAVSAFIRILISESQFDSQTAPLDRSHQDLSIATRIGRNRPRTRPHTPLEVSGSPAKRARADQHSHAPSRARSLLSARATILSWFINTSVPAISSLLPRLETGQATWSFLATRYNYTYDFALEFYIEVKLYQMSQESGQSISDYYSETAFMWEQLVAADPPLRYAEDIDLFAKYKDCRRFTQFMMGLREDFEPTRAALLNVVLVTPRPPASSSDRPRRICKYCKKPGHDITECYRKQKDNKKKQHQSRGTFPRPQVAAMSSTPVDDPVNPLTGKLLGTGRKIGRLFELCNLQIPSHMVSSSIAATTTLSPDLWHSRLGHASLSRLQLLASQGHLGSLPTFPFISSSMTLIFTDPSINLYPDPVRDFSPPPSFSDVPSLVLSPAPGSPASDPIPSAPSESPTDIRRSTRVRAPPSYLTDYHCYFALATLHELHTYCETSTNPFWQQVMADKLDALHKTHTWDMTTLPPSKSAVGCKWVYKIKTQADGSVERYKARLVAKGFTQEYGIDYDETFVVSQVSPSSYSQVSLEGLTF